MNFDARKHLLDYDDVLNKQRLAMYKKRQDILTGNNLPLATEQRQLGTDSETPHAPHVAQKSEAS